LAKDSRWAAINRVRTECSFRDGVWRFPYNPTTNVGLDYNSREICYEQIAPDLIKQVGHTQIVHKQIAAH